MQKHTKLTPYERDKIAPWLAEKKSLNDIAKLLGRSVSTISDEVKRNSKNGVYSSISAQMLSEMRISKGRKRNPKKPDWVYAHVEDKLKLGWSPEQISGRLKRKYGTNVIRIKHLKQASLSVTMDNGKENYDHRKLNDIGIDTYFCDPYSSWQKGSNENHNGILRRYIPKKTDLTSLSQTELNWIIQDINSKPRKCLDYETAEEAFARELSSIKLTGKVKCSDS